MLAKNPRMPECLGFNLQVFSEDQSKSSELNSALHNLIYNYGEHPVNFSWLEENSWKHKTIEPEIQFICIPMSRIRCGQINQL